MRPKIKSFLLGISTLILFACHSSSNDPKNGANPDTVLKTAADTMIIPGTPGPSGSAPRARDTTQNHRDSLKRASHISDISGSSNAKPK